MISLPDLDTTQRIDVGSLLRRSAEKYPEKKFLTFTETGKTLSYNQFDILVNRVANGFIGLGVQPGAYVNVMIPNKVEYLLTSYALKRIGAIEVAINCEFRGPALTRMLNLAESDTWVCAGEFADQLGAILGDICQFGRMVVVGSLSAIKDLGWEKTDLIEFDQLILDANEEYPEININDLDPALVIFTSGTTGISKGCLLSHRAMVRMAESARDAMELSSDDIIYTAYPLFHARAALLDVLGSILVGGGVILAPRFSARRFWEHMVDFDVTVFSIIGTVMQILWKQPVTKRERDHNVRITWGGPITVEPKEFEARFGVKVLPGAGVFGMSETGMLCMSSLYPEKSGKVRAIYNVRIADDNDDPVPTGEIGEILVRSREPGVMYYGYLAMPEATVGAWRNLWFHTGDLGRIDSDGRLTFLGRKQEMIRRGGHNISAWEIEEIINGHPAVLECAALAVPCDLGEDEVKIYVVLEPGKTFNTAEILKYSRMHMAGFMVPQHIEFIPEIPKTQTGKLAVAKLKSL